MTKQIIILIIMICTFNTLEVYSKELNSNHFYGIYGSYGLNSHSSDFKRLPDCPSCSPGFRDGSGMGLSLGFIYDYKISSDFYFSSKLSFNDLSGELVQKESTIIIVNSNLVNGEFTHYLNSTLSTIGLEPHIKFNPFGDLFLNAGFNICSLINKDYSQIEKITKPDNLGTFVDENGINTFSRERNKFEGTLEKANSIYFAPFLSISYQLPLNYQRSIILEPEISYFNGLTNVVVDDS